MSTVWRSYHRAPACSTRQDRRPISATLQKLSSHALESSSPDLDLCRFKVTTDFYVCPEPCFFCVSAPTCVHEGRTSCKTTSMPVNPEQIENNTDG
ncbi:hypothetical protein GWI33_021649 [Rhynchophorus ferrugineus]|uniref:Uncharacterized protein n=1 Tax=Rhynchophorus ferrugineus TaxID=354439 RepID=A0A834ITJ4_RHYFE|nr:hypothetical protein GWI33_021649 [Rhynchophorus ferrugineus]